MVALAVAGADPEPEPEPAPAAAAAAAAEAAADPQYPPRGYYPIGKYQPGYPLAAHYQPNHNPQPGYSRYQPRPYAAPQAYGPYAGPQAYGPYAGPQAYGPSNYKKDYSCDPKAAPKCAENSTLSYCLKDYEYPEYEVKVIIRLEREIIASFIVSIIALHF